MPQWVFLNYPAKAPAMNKFTDTADVLQHIDGRLWVLEFMVCSVVAESHPALAKACFALFEELRERASRGEDLSPGSTGMLRIEGTLRSAAERHLKNETALPELPLAQ